MLGRILDLAIQTAWGLDHAHAKGLVHQDVKPANVLLDVDGTAKVTDFGLARAYTVSGRETRPGLSPNGSLLVPSGGLTPAYASPEQAAGERLGRRTDVYSFAVSVLEMFTGCLAWRYGPWAKAGLDALRMRGAWERGMPELPPPQTLPC